MSARCRWLRATRHCHCCCHRERYSVRHECSPALAIGSRRGRSLKRHHAVNYSACDDGSDGRTRLTVTAIVQCLS